MPKYELALAVADEADLASGHQRKKEGDIVAVMPSPHNWGRKEIDAHLIVPVEIDDDYGTVVAKLRANGASGEKRCMKVDLNDLKTNYLPELDLTKVRSKTMIYQPFKTQMSIINSLPSYGLKVADVDCGSQPEIEISAGKNPTDLVYSKDASGYIDVKAVVRPTLND